MSHNKDTNKNSYQGSCKGTRSVKPYDRNQSLLSRVKNAVQGYFIPSWVQAVISPQKSINETGREFADSAENGCMVASSSSSSEAEISKPGIGFFQNPNPASSEGGTSTNLKRRQMDSFQKDGMKRENLALEPQCKRRALESVEFVEDDDQSPSFRLTPVGSSTPVGRSSIRPIGGSSLATDQSLANASKSQDHLSKNSFLFSLDSKLKTPERASLMSPFYNGPIAYGGANACQQQAQKSIDGTDSEEHQVLISKKKSNFGLSKTTQKILKVLDGNKTEHIDKMGLPPLTFDNKRHKSLMTEVFSKGKKSAHGPPVKEMSMPTQLSIKPNYAFMNAETSKSNEGAIEDGKSLSNWTGKIRREREKHHEFRGQDTKTDEVIEKDDLDSLSHIKLPPIALAPLSSTPSSLSSTLASSSEPVRAPSTGLCKQSAVNSSSTGLCVQSSDFKFSLPHFIQGKRCVTGKDQYSDTNFKFSEPKSKAFHEHPVSQTMAKSLLSDYQIDFNAAVKKPSLAPSNEGMLFGPAKELKTGSVMDFLKKDLCNNNVPDSSQSKAHGSPLKELFKKSSNSKPVSSPGMSSNSSTTSSSAITNTNVSNGLKTISSVTTTSSTAVCSQPTTVNESNKALSLSEMFSARPGEWSCGVCMVRNPTEAVKCVACETSKPGLKNQVASSEQNKTLSLSEMFSAKPGEWNCEACMVRNRPEAVECVACEASKPDLKKSVPGPSSSMKDSNQDKWRCDTCKLENSHTLSVCPCCSTSKSGKETSKKEPSSSLSALFAAKPGEWNCEVCMIKNKAEATKCAACETSKPGTEAVNNSKKETADMSQQLVIKTGTGGFTFGSALSSDFTFLPKSEPAKEPENKATFGGFKPSFGCLSSATTSSSGFTAFGGGFKFSPSSQSLTDVQVQSLPSTNTTSSDTAPTTVTATSNGPLAFSFQQSTKTTSKDENLNNSNSLFTNSKTKISEFAFGAQDFKTSATPNFQFGSNSATKESSNISTFGNLSQPTSTLASVPVNTSLFKTSASGFDVKEKMLTAQFGLSNSPSAPTASLKPFTVSDGSSAVFGQNAVSGLNNTSNNTGNNTSLPLFGQSFAVSSTLVTTSPSALTFGQNLTANNAVSVCSNPILPIFGQASTVCSTNVAANLPPMPVFGQTSAGSSTNVAANIPSMPVFGQKLTSSNPTSAGNNATLPLFGQIPVAGTTSMANNPSMPLFGQKTTTTTTTSSVNIGTNHSLPTFGQNVTAPNSVGAFSFGSSSTGLFAKPSQNTSNLFGQTSQQSSVFAANTIPSGSGFSFKNSDNATGIFGGSQSSVGNAFNFGGTRTSSNGDDMMVESPQPSLPAFGFNKTSTSAGFNFGNNNNNGSNLFGTTNTSTSQGFSFPSVPASFNFGQAPQNVTSNQQTPQWGQQAPNNTEQPFNFGANTNISFTSGNVAFSAGGTQGGRVIKKATRRMPKRS